MDGMGDRPLKELDYQTPLQAANTPNMDKMAEEGINGIMDSIAPGIIPGSDTAHISILGYDPYVVYTGRGPFEASGVGVDVIPGDIAFRCNFSTVDEDGIVTDRRAGRIREGTKDIVDVLNTMVLEDYPDVNIIFKESTGHRAVLVLRGEGLSDKVSDADPKVEGNKPKDVVALDGSKEAEKTADILNKVVAKSYEMVKDHPVNLERIENNEQWYIIEWNELSIASTSQFEDPFTQKRWIGLIQLLWLLSIPGSLEQKHFITLEHKGHRWQSIRITHFSFYQYTTIISSLIPFSDLYMISKNRRSIYSSHIIYYHTSYWFGFNINEWSR